MTYAHVELLTVRAWGRIVGYVAAAGRAWGFEYDPSWRRHGVDLAPLLMPSTSRQRLFVFPTPTT